jgi:hypothetical protein
MKAVLLDLPAVTPAPPEKMKSSIYFNDLFGRKSWIYGRYVQFACPGGRERTSGGSPNALRIKKRHDSGPLYA